MVTIDGEGKALRAAKVLKCPASCSKRMAGCLAETHGLVSGGCYLETSFSWSFSLPIPRVHVQHLLHLIMIYWIYRYCWQGYGASCLSPITIVCMYGFHVFSLFFFIFPYIPTVHVYHHC